MAEDFLGSFIGDAVRARVLRAFIFGQSEPLTLMQAAKRSGVSPRGALREIHALESLGIIRKSKSVPAPKSAWKLPKKKTARSQTKKSEAAWCLDTNFKHSRALSMFVHEVSPVRYNKIIEILKRIGKISTVVISGSFMGDPSRPADLLIAGDVVNDARLEAAMRALESHFGREIRYASFSTPEFRYRLTIQDRLIRETLDYPHLVLLDRTKLL